MCLAVPAKVIAIKGELATVEVGGNTRKINIMLIPEVNVGDFVLIHAGYAMERLDKREAQETLKLLEAVYAEIVE